MLVLSRHRDESIAKKSMTQLSEKTKKRVAWGLKRPVTWVSSLKLASSHPETFVVAGIRVTMSKRAVLNAADF